MQTEDIQAVIEQLVTTVDLLCKQVADLVDDRSTRALDREDAPGIRLMADKLRAAGRTLQQTLAEATLRTNR